MFEGHREVDAADSQRLIMSWATAEELDSVLVRMRALQRQTMNFRTSSSARMLLIRRAGRLVAWGGVDAHTEPAEIFSQFVEEDHRKKRLGQILEAARLAFLAQHNLTVAYCRMDAFEKESLLQYRLSRGDWRPAPNTPEVKSYASRCHQCELFGNLCREQRYFVIDVARALRHLERYVGRIPMDSLPQSFLIVAPPESSPGRPLRTHPEDSGDSPVGSVRWL